MKKTLFLLLPALALLCACSKNGTCSEDACESTFLSYGNSHVYALEGSARAYDLDSDYTICDSVALIIPLKLKDIDVEALRDTILMRSLGVTSSDIPDAVSLWFKNMAKESVDEVGFKVSPTDKAVGLTDGFRRVQGRIVNMSTEVLSYCIATSVYYPGAANGFESWDYVNYSLRENRMITLADLFTKDGISQLPAKINEQAQMNPRYEGLVSIDALPENGNFYLSSEGEIVFSYQPMEVGPHSLGNVQVSFYPYELVGLLTTEAIRDYGLEDLAE